MKSAGKRLGLRRTHFPEPPPSPRTLSPPTLATAPLSAYATPNPLAAATVQATSLGEPLLVEMHATGEVTRAHRLVQGGRC